MSGPGGVTRTEPITPNPHLLGKWITRYSPVPKPERSNTRRFQEETLRRKVTRGRSMGKRASGAGGAKPRAVRGGRSGRYEERRAERGTKGR